VTNGKAPVNQGLNLRILGLVGQVGVILVVFILAGLAIGRWIDGRLNASPTFTLGFILLGIAAGGWIVARLVMWALETSAAQSRKRKE
jgi:F0F1-type ATP synthase assembly protein I